MEKNSSALELLSSNEPIINYEYWVHVYDLCNKDFEKLLKKTADRVVSLERDFEDGNFTKKNYQKYKIAKIIEEDLNIMYGFKLMIDQMDRSFMATSKWLQKPEIERYEQKIVNLMYELDNQRKVIMTLRECLAQAEREEAYFLQQLIKFHENESQRNSKPIK